jgi:hypothetical protein
MIAFEVSLNGKRVCLAGIGNNGVLSQHVTWVGRKGVRSPLPRLHVGGLDTETDEHVVWAEDSIPTLKKNDVVTIRIVDVEHVDIPTERYKWDARGKKLKTTKSRASSVKKRATRP